MTIPLITGPAASADLKAALNNLTNEVNSLVAASSGGGTNSGLVLMTSGTIMPGAGYFDVSLPGLYVAYQLSLYGVSASIIDNAGFVFSADDGVTWIYSTDFPYKYNGGS